MGFNGVITEERSEDKVTKSNGRWEIEDGQNQYLYDEKVTVAAADRCRGYRQGGRGWGHAPNQQCSQKATKKWGGILCKKCADDLHIYAASVKSAFWVAAFKADIEDIKPKWVNFVTGVEDDDTAEWRQTDYSIRSARMLDLQVWELIEPQFILHGIVSPDEWDLLLEQTRQHGITAQEQQIYYTAGHYHQYDDESPSQAHADRLKVVVALLKGNPIEIDYPAVPVNCCTGFDADGKPFWNEHYEKASERYQKAYDDQFDAWTKTWRDALTNGRLKLSDLVDTAEVCQSLAGLIMSHKHKADALYAELSDIRSDIGSRPMPWHEEEEPEVPDLLEGSE